MPDTITVDNAVDDAGDGAIEAASFQPDPAPATLDSIMALLITLKAELDDVKARADLVTPPSSVWIELTCRPTPAITPIAP